MKQILLVPDSFKGTLTSRQVCETMAEQLHLVFPEADITSLPVADGGEGSVDAFFGRGWGRAGGTPRYWALRRAGTGLLRPPS